MAEALIGSNRFYNVPFPVVIGNRYVHVARRADGSMAVQVFRWDPNTKTVREESVSVGKGLRPTLSVMPDEQTGGLRLVAHGEGIAGYASEPAYTILLQPDRIQILRGDTPAFEMTGSSLAGFDVGIQVEDSGIALGGSLPDGFEIRHLYEKRTVVLATMVTAAEPVLQRHRFVECHILGPTLLCSLGSASVTGGTFEMAGLPGESIVWEMRPGQVPYGAVLLKDVDFENCTFFNVAFGAPPGEAQSLLAGIQG